MNLIDGRMCKKIVLKKDVDGIPAGTEGALIRDNEDGFSVIRCCGKNFVIRGEYVEVIEGDGIGASQSAGTGSASAVGENTNDGESDVSGVCEKCGAVLRQAGPVGQ
jgi:hypothetical protein